MAGFYRALRTKHNCTTEKSIATRVQTFVYLLSSGKNRYLEQKFFNVYLFYQLCLQLRFLLLIRTGVEPWPRVWSFIRGFTVIPLVILLYIFDLTRNKSESY